MIVLGIDTSCDDTSAACVKDRKILSSIVFSQLFHAKYGGVVPELASRDHIRNIIPIVNEVIKPVGTHKLNGIGVTYGPGLVGSLFIGLSFAKSLSYALGIPFYGVNHIEGHIFSLFIDREPKLPFIALIVSGGHTEIILVKEKGSYKYLGTTLDDAAGEAFDKVARLLGLPYPGGNWIEQLAMGGDPQAIDFPRAQVSGYDFSFSGLKTAVMYYIRNQKLEIRSQKRAIAASFQEAIVDSLIDKLIKASKDFNVPRIGIAGGVSANERLREKLKEIGEKEKIEVYFSEKEFCTDNAVMIAICAQHYLSKSKTSPFSLKADSRALLLTG
ncbi:tRNA (adenosine(37)-N6)-threonylcarbamoyltransferase complex transferase subunit TsaD [candidate division WOR-3 bacterium]|nr:tRNA (adenosine(37)-N6)-threonylcarbamoyltransferase complex transferase subunit TsaD [candidate division WOR-3 bacterium]